MLLDSKGRIAHLAMLQDVLKPFDGVVHATWGKVRIDQYRTVDLSFCSPESVLVEIVRQMYSAGVDAGKNAAQEKMRQALGIGDDD